VKFKTILSVGRYTPSHTIDSKKQLELTKTFMEMDEGLRAGWQFCCAGRVSDVPVDREYYEAVRRHGGPSALALADVTREELNRLLGRAAIFWHATGLGTDPDTEPHASEHFGISTVEAMASGCVPLLINRGGMTELVQHGVNGFLWNDLAELKDFTTLLIKNEPLRRQLSEAARQRGQHFSQARFLQGFRHHVGPFASELAPAEAGKR
jgi:glycosyltransferase involved in cell wall biosynthesis